MNDAQKWAKYHAYIKNYNDTLSRQRVMEKEYKKEQQRMKLALEKLKPINEEIRKRREEQLCRELQREMDIVRRILRIPKTIHWDSEANRFLREI